MPLKTYKVLGDGFQFPEGTDHTKGSTIEVADDHQYEGLIRTALANGQLQDVTDVGGSEAPAPVEEPVLPGEGRTLEETEPTMVEEGVSTEQTDQNVASLGHTVSDQTQPPVQAQQFGPFEVVVEWTDGATVEEIQEAQGYIHEIHGDLELAEGTEASLPAVIKSILVRRIA